MGTRGAAQFQVAHRFLDSVLTLAAAALLSLMSIPAAGQTPTKPAEAWSPSRTSDGQPDVQAIVVLYQFQHAYRVIPLDGRPHVADQIKLWMGDSRRRWQGNTLVVDVSNRNDMPWFDWVGNFHTDALHIVERWTFVDPDTIKYDAAMEDSNKFTRGWTIALTFTRNKEEGYELMEDACYEGHQLSADRYAPARAF